MLRVARPVKAVRSQTKARRNQKGLALIPCLDKKKQTCMKGDMSTLVPGYSLLMQPFATGLKRQPRPGASWPGLLAGGRGRGGGTVESPDVWINTT